MFFADMGLRLGILFLVLQAACFFTVDAQTDNATSLSADAQPEKKKWRVCTSNLPPTVRKNSW